MTPTQREAALRLADDMNTPISVWADHVAHLLRELAAEPQGEPMQNRGWLEAAVAWEVCASIHQKWAKGKDALFTTRHTDFVKHADDARAKAKLYTHPPQQRKPLSDEQIYAAISDQVFWATSKNFIVRVVRDVEAAHGITGGKE